MHFRHGCMARAKSAGVRAEIFYLLPLLLEMVGSTPTRESEEKEIIYEMIFVKKFHLGWNKIGPSFCSSTCT